MSEPPISRHKRLYTIFLSSSLEYLMPAFQIRQAIAANLPKVAELFDSYRQFYRQAAGPCIAEAFIRERLTKNDSVIFLATDVQAGTALGFVQLYPSFSSVAARQIWILNDLFVAPDARRKGIGRGLLYAARNYALSTGAIRLVLSTASSNYEARALYESCGYKEDDIFMVYKLEL